MTVFFGGLGVSPGKIIGRPITVDHYKHLKMDALQNDNLILLIENLSLEVISELILDGNILGIVAERGGICSHGATLAREAKLPCVVSKRGIETLFVYATIQIDGTSGDIEAFE